MKTLSLILFFSLSFTYANNDYFVLEKRLDYRPGAQVSIATVNQLITRAQRICPKTVVNQSTVNTFVRMNNRTIISTLHNTSSKINFCANKMLSLAIHKRFLESQSKLAEIQKPTPTWDMASQAYARLLNNYKSRFLIPDDMRKFITINNPEFMNILNPIQRSLIPLASDLFMYIFIDSLRLLQSASILNQDDLRTIIQKTRIELTDRCDFIHWYTEVYIETQYPENITTTWLSNLTYKVNICTKPDYITNLDKHFNALIVHELAHYHYYIKDTTVWDFTNICVIQKCQKSDYVSDYASTNPEEDYAETFQFWFLRKFVPPTPILNQKMQYFERKYPR